ncbi:hypothetical protein Emtol_1876 [Emticicia oligotrophica DSM 17448]|uniref:Uncharacterized protein n=1 Tax=Emticicia oligotrophica (strain DSM 17448 / CIP 109782 / MTCC 6937 / GPTSA100-15) TaxID=929562 RepID=A0ABN4AL19_EMTOG|nr:hypothetical protein [Emticicia oligotrophica]AFK03017.1 hypothetical protein Emtol_1876 [Emticicia oligotrophica DSM 17448]
MICDNGKLVIEAPITTEKVKTLKNTILQNPIFEEQGITLPPITDEFLTKISNEATCQTAIEGLVKDVQGTSLKEDFNDLVSTGKLVEDAVEAIDNIIFMKPPPIIISINACFDGVNPTNAPKSDIHNWYNSALHKDWKHLYADWGNFITIKENGKYYHICRQTTDGWGDEKFMFVEAGKTNYQEFKPVGYDCPKDTYIAYGQSLNAFGDMMGKSIIIATTTFATGGLGSAAGLGILGEIGLNMGVEASKQMVTLYIEQGKDFSMQSVVDNLDLFDIAIEGLPIVNKTIGIMGGKEVAILAKNYFKDILTATFDYKNKDKWQIAFFSKKPSQAIGDLVTDRLAGELIGKYSSIWEKSFTDAGIKQDLAIKIIQEFSIKTKEYAAEILNFTLVNYFNRSDLGELLNDNFFVNK